MKASRLFTLAIVALTVLLSACSDTGDETVSGDRPRVAVASSPETADAETDDAVSPSDDSDDGTASTTTLPDDADAASTTVPLTSPDLEITVPEVEPEATGFEVIEVGDGQVTASGDLVSLAWEMVAFDTGEVVESTKDSGGPVPVLLGSGFVPVALDEAVTGQTIGTQLEVLFPAGMEDLPSYLDSGTAYVLAVQLVGIQEPDTPEPTSSTTTPATTVSPTTAPATTTAPLPSTTVPAGELRVVAADGPLAVDMPAGVPLPGRNYAEVVKQGDGALLAEGDNVQIAYVMVSWTTGEVVRATVGSEQIILGAREVPRFLESSIFQKPVGSRLQVIYGPNLFDLPEGLDPDDAYVVAVDIVSAS